MLEDAFSETLDTVATRADEAAAIPHFEKHLWSEDRYEMKRTEYWKLTSRLKYLSEEAPGILKGNLEGIKQAVSNIQSAEKEAKRYRSKLADLEGLQKRFTQHRKQIDQLSRQH